MIIIEVEAKALGSNRELALKAQRIRGIRRARSYVSLLSFVIQYI